MTGRARLPAMAFLDDRLPPTATRVELRTDATVRAAIRERADLRIDGLEGAGGAAIGDRLAALEAEWDVERLLQVQASALVLAGVALGLGVHRRYLWLPAAVLAFLGQHAAQGWCPPLPLLRRLGVRTVREVARERHALKALRGDFDGVPVTGSASPAQRVVAALAAVDA